MRFPKLPARKDTPDDEELHPQEPATPAGGPSSGYGDVVMPDLPPPPLTSELTRSIRFTISEPQGYYFEQVENFVQQVGEALTYYEQAEFAWRQAVYEMQIEMDQQAYDLQRVRSEIELFKVQGSPLVNADGSYVTESQQAASDTLADDFARAQSALVDMQEAIAERDTEVARLQGVAASQDQDIVSLRQWGDQMSADFQSMQEQLAAAMSENEALRMAPPQDIPAVPVDAVPEPVSAEQEHQPEEVEVVSEMPAADVPEVHLPTVVLSTDSETVDAEEGEDYDDEYDDEYDDTDDAKTDDADTGAPEALTEEDSHDEVAVDDAGDGDISYAGFDDGEEYGESVAVVPVDSELPEGAHLPGTGENAITYPPAAPGLPLDTQGVPVEVWAPELDTRLHETSTEDTSDDEEAGDEVSYEDEPLPESDAQDAEDTPDDVPPDAGTDTPVETREPMSEPTVDASDDHSPVSHEITEGSDADELEAHNDGQPSGHDVYDPEGEDADETVAFDGATDEPGDLYAEYDDDGEEYGESVAVVPVDSELPEGAHLPGTGENAITYPPAAPGLPLDTQGVPVEVWAPELNPRLRAALEADKREHDAAEHDTDDEDDESQQ